MQVCTCRSCEITRKRINAVIADLTDKEIDLKRTDFVFKPSIEVTDTDKEPSKVNEID